MDQPFREEIIKQLEFKVQLKVATAQLVVPAAQVLLQKIKIAKEVRAEMDKIQELKTKIEGMKKTQKAKNDHILK